MSNSFRVCVCVYVRWCSWRSYWQCVTVLAIGNAGTGKTQVMRSLQRTCQNTKCRPVWVDLNPGAVTNDELFGIIIPAARG